MTGGAGGRGARLLCGGARPKLGAVGRLSPAPRRRTAAPRPKCRRLWRRLASKRALRGAVLRFWCAAMCGAILAPSLVWFGSFHPRLGGVPLHLGLGAVAFGAGWPRNAPCGAQSCGSGAQPCAGQYSPQAWCNGEALTHASLTPFALAAHAARLRRLVRRARENLFAAAWCRRQDAAMQAKFCPSGPITSTNFTPLCRGHNVQSAKPCFPGLHFAGGHGKLIYVFTNRAPMAQGGVWRWPATTAEAGVPLGSVPRPGASPYPHIKHRHKASVHPKAPSPFLFGHEVQNLARVVAV